jgi:hypothetical protein
MGDVMKPGEVRNSADTNSGDEKKSFSGDSIISRDVGGDISPAAEGGGGMSTESSLGEEGIVVTTSVLVSVGDLDNILR